MEPPTQSGPVSGGSITSCNLNSAFGSGGARVTTNQYSAAGTNPIQTVTVTVGAQVVSKTFLAQVGSQAEYITATSPTAAWNDPSNLVTTITRYSSGPFVNQIQSQTNPDGTVDLYTRNKDGTGQITVIHQHGVPSGSSVSDGTITTTVTNPWGEEIQNTLVDAGSGLTTAYSVANSVDNLGRPLSISLLGGLTESKAYSCCNLSSDTDQTGVTTTYGYDALNRLISTTRLGITETLTLDAEGRTVKRQRTGSDGSTFTLEQTSYDLAGRISQTVDPLGKVTTYAYSHPSGGGVTTTMTYPDGGTRIETTYADGRTASITGTAVQPVQYVYGTWSGGETTQEIKLLADPANPGQFLTTEWTKTYTDLAGRTVRIEYPDGAATTMAYDNHGHMIQQVDPDGVTTLYAYNGKGEQIQSCIDLNGNGSIDVGGTDRITETLTDVTTDHGATVQRTITNIYAINGSSTPTTSSVAEQSVDGLSTWNTQLQQTSSRIQSLAGSGNSTTTQTNPDGTQVVQTYTNGQMASSTTQTSDGTQLSSISYAYDGRGRLQSQTDARTGETDFTYNDRDQLLTTTAPAPAAGGGNLVTTNGYDDMGRLHTVTLPDSTVTTNLYYPTGQLHETSGSQTYTVDYGYDSQGNMTSMTTNYGGSGNFSTTTWAYDGQRGWLNGKIYPDLKTTAYTYTPAGRLLTRTWARPVAGQPLITTYGYNAAGDLTGVTYSDGVTPNVTMSYTRWGAKSQVTDATGTTNYSYNNTTDFQPYQETLDPTFYNHRILTRQYDTMRRNAGFQVGTTGALASDHSVSYGYDSGGRLGSVTSLSDSYTYTYVANSNLVSTSSSSAAGRLTTFSYEPGRNAITTVQNKVGATTITQYTYGVNRIGQRATRAQSGTAISAASSDTFSYDLAGEVTGDSNDTVSALNRAYNYDAIGNRKSSTAASVTTTYAPNVINQYSSFTVGTGTPLAPSYDDDGNMTQYVRPSDGKVLTLVWDAENRLISVVPASPGSGDVRIDNVYDAQSRRVEKKVSLVSGGTLQSDEKYLYDDWNIIVVYNAASGTALERSYTWGNDLSGTPKGAGGVDGLLGCLEHAAGSTATTNYTFTYDANGNVSDVVDNTGTVAAHYEYDPFGNTTAATGSYASANSYRFSTKFADESKFYYYGYRFYDTQLGRWLSRDPLYEEGGVNLCSIKQNDFIDLIDRLGESVNADFVDTGAKVISNDDYDNYVQKKNYPSNFAAVTERRFKISIDSHPGKRKILGNPMAGPTTLSWIDEGCGCTFTIKNITLTVGTFIPDRFNIAVAQFHESEHRRQHRIAFNLSTAKFSRSRFVAYDSSNSTETKCQEKADQLKKELEAQIREPQNKAANAADNLLSVESSMEQTKDVFGQGDAIIDSYSYQDWKDSK